MSAKTTSHNYVPQIILQNFARGNFNGRFSAAALFVDLSGFTALTDQLMTHGQHGAELLARLVGEIFDPLIDAVYAQGGFITGFGGDAFTAVFPDTIDLFTARALTAAVTIQDVIQARPEQETPYDRYALSAKVGVAWGEVSWGIITSEDDQQASYYFQGTAIDGCAEAESAAQPGEIILDAASYKITSKNGMMEAVGDHYRLTSLNWPLPKLPPTENLTQNIEYIMHFVPQAVVRAGRVGEFRQVVNMFISLPTIRTEVQLKIFMQTVFSLQKQYGGILRHLDFGDKGAKLLLFWGAPIAYENDIQRALHFILDLQMLTAIPISGGLTYRIAHAGYIGSALRGEYTSYGRGVNLAARYMIGAARGEIWVDEHIALRAGAQFDLEYEGQKPFKGFAEPQKVYVLFERLDFSDAFYDGRLIGREADLARLSEFVVPIFEGDAPGLFIIWGEPGAGKSRLANEFLSQHLRTDKETQVFLAQADEILRQSLNLFRYWLKRYFGQSEGLAESRNKRSFNRQLDQLIAETESQASADELDRLRSFLGALVGLYWPDSLYEQENAKSRQEHTMSALSALLQAESRRQPTILLLEDVHWLDQDSATFLSTLLTDLSKPDKEHMPLALLATARDEGDNLLIHGVPYQEMVLSSLNPSELQVLTATYLESPPADDLLELLVNQTGGNPFFAEQILHYLQESEQLEKADGRWRLTTRGTSPLPQDVNALLVARLDRLAYAVRQVVQTAAILGREFEVRVLAQILRGDAILPSKLAIAERESIWSALDDIRYIFKHALLRDAAYRMQLRAQRQSLHKLALAAVEALFITDLSGRYGELAYHALQAELFEPAFKYSLLAGEQAMAQYAAVEAVEHYRPAVKLLSQIKTSSEQRRQLCVQYGRALELAGDFAAALAHYETMEDLAREFGDQALELTALVAQGTIRSTGNYLRDSQLAESLSEKGLELAALLNDSAAESKIRWNMIHVYRLTGRYEEAMTSGLHAFEIAEAFGLREQMAYIANDLSTIFMGLGQISKMLDNGQRAIALWRELNNRPMLIDSLATYGLATAMTGQFNDALAIAEEGIAISQATDNHWGEAIMRYTPVLVHLQRLEIEAGLVHSEISLRLARDGGVIIAQFYMGLFQSLLFLAGKDYQQALNSAGQILTVTRQHIPFLEPAVLGVMAIIQIEQGEINGAGALIDQFQVNPEQRAMLMMLLPELATCRYMLAQAAYSDLILITQKVTEFVQEQGITFLAPQFYKIQGQAQIALSDHEAARESVQSGLSLIQQTGARWGRSELASLMDDLQRSQN